MDIFLVIHDKKAVGRFGRATMGDNCDLGDFFSNGCFIRSNSWDCVLDFVSKRVSPKLDHQEAATRDPRNLLVLGHVAFYLLP